MPTVQIVIDVSGQAAGSPGVAREFAYSVVSPTPPTVTLSVANTDGITSYAWSILNQPVGATATLSSATAAAPTFTPTASVAGTYLLECIVNGGVAYDRNAIAFTTENLAMRKPAPAETNQFDTDRGWDPAMNEVVDYVDVQAGGASGHRKQAVINIVDCTAAPPTETLNDRYIIDDTVGSVHGDWDGAAKLSIVQFNGSLWVEYAPIEGWVTYVDAADKDARFVDDPADAWEYIATSANVKVSSDDTTEGYLEDKITAGSGITLTTLNPAGNEELQISAGGGAQWTDDTGDAVQTEIYVDGTPGSRYTLSASNSVGFVIYVTAASHDGNTKRWRVDGAIDRDGSNNTTLVDDPPTQTVVAESSGASTWAIAVEADDTNEALIIKVTGQASTNISWQADGAMDAIAWPAAP